MSDKCPHCGGEMLDDTRDDRAEFWSAVQRCANCVYWEDATIQSDGTIIATAHEPNHPESPDSCEGEEG